MSLIDLISKEEDKVITAFRDIAADGRRSEDRFCSNRYFLRFWDENKKDLFSKVFKDRLILKRNIKLNLLDDQAIKDQFTDLFYSSYYLFIKGSMHNFLVNQAVNDSSLSGKEIDNRWDCFNSIFGIDSIPDNFITNRYNGKDISITMPSGKEFKITTGMKLMKILGHFAKELNFEEEFERFRLKHSQILNEAKIESTLCLSIHPLDYMTASYNENDWRSCMCWNDGDYCRGVIEMMNSPVVVVAYLESHSEKVEPARGLFWNSKKWREFFIVNDELISGIKGYPYWNAEIEEICINWLKELIYTNSSGTKVYGEIVNKDSIYSDYDFSINFTCGPAMYNDFCYSKHILALSTEFKVNKVLSSSKIKYYELDYSGESECVCCGQTDYEVDFDGTDQLCCVECSDYISCEICGEHVNSNDAYQSFGNHFFCEDCFSSLAICDCCGIVLPIKADDDNQISDEFATFITYPEADNTEILADMSICGDCYKDIFVDGRSEITKTHERILRKGPYSWWTRNNFIIPFVSLTKKGQKLASDIGNF